jgi:ElaA protein
MNLVFQHRAFCELSLQELHDLLWLRNLVFVCGQKITIEPEIDGRDPECCHVLGYGEESLIATARLFWHRDPVRVGRIAVRPDWQGQGVGTQLMTYINALLGAERQGEMSAQAHLQPWYSRLGWHASGDLYDEAGIPHIHMVWRGREKPCQ